MVLTSYFTIVQMFLGITEYTERIENVEDKNNVQSLKKLPN